MNYSTIAGSASAWARCVLLLATLIMALGYGEVSWAAPATAANGLKMLGIPVEFILFAITLLGVALFHHYTLQVALGGLATIVAYKLALTGFKDGSGVAGLAAHLHHEWVILANLLCLLVGFELLSRHFERSHVPEVLPRILPDDWKGAFMLLVLVWVMSGFLDNIAAALIGATVAGTVFKHKVHIGYLAAIVAASNAGGAGSVVGDTTTTMMWLAGVSPLDVLAAYLPAAVALVVFGIPASLQQQRHAPIIKHEPRHAPVDWARVAIVGVILVSAIGTNVVVNLNLIFSIHRCRGLDRIVGLRAGPQARLEARAGGIQGQHFPACPGYLRLDDARGNTAATDLAFLARSGIHIVGIRQHPIDRAGFEAGRLRLGDAGLCGRFRWIHDLVRLEFRRRGVQSLSGSQVGMAVDSPRMAHSAWICCGVCRDADGPRLATARAAKTRRAGCSDILLGPHRACRHVRPSEVRSAPAAGEFAVSFM